jgi:hypothetical protein
MLSRPPSKFKDVLAALVVVGSPGGSPFQMKVS